MRPCGAEPRFSWVSFVPESFRAEQPIMVIVHSTGRRPVECVELFSPLAQETGSAVLAPHFPIGALAADGSDADGYKFLQFEDVRFDELVCSMIDELAAEIGADGRRVLMHGFSGGGQFAHRFFYLHPERLAGVSIGAPGRATLLDDSRAWWAGTADVEERFGHRIDLAALARVPVVSTFGSSSCLAWHTRPWVSLRLPSSSSAVCWHEASCAAPTVTA